MSDMQIGNNVGGVGQGYVQNENSVDGTQAQKVLQPIMGQEAVVVSVKNVDVRAFVERLKVATRQQREEQQQSLMSSAISSVLGRIAATDAEQAELLKSLGEQTDRYLALMEQVALLAEACYAKDPTVQALEIKVKELEAMVEAMRETPEERKKKAEKKERDAAADEERVEISEEEALRQLKEAQKALSQAQASALANDTDYQDAVKELEEVRKSVNDTINKLDHQSAVILSQALREAFFMPTDDEIFGDKDRQVKVADNLQFFVELLGGADLQNLIATGRMETNFI